MIGCELFHRHIGAFVDGELDPATQMEFEQHVDACADCQEVLAFELSYRDHMRESFSGIKAPAGLKDRVVAALDETPLSAVDVSSPSWSTRARSVLPVAAAAAAVAVIGTGLLVSNDGDLKSAAITDILRTHSLQLPPDVRVADDTSSNERVAQDAVADYFRGKVEFPVTPARFQSSDMRFVGARLSNVRERPSAALFYSYRGRPVTVVVTDAPGLAPGEEATRHVDGRALRYWDVSGRTVPVRQEAGLSYAFTGDVDREELLRLAAGAQVHF